jgi:NAD(P)-dependent dehydrogenase (short-subunit alcohol dehydrogenase family)
LEEKELSFANARALVVGGSRGIGRAVAIELARRGADVAVIYRASETQANEVVDAVQEIGRKALAVRADLADAQAVGRGVDQAVAFLGGLDTLIQAAGAMGTWKSVADLTVAEWDRYIAVDLCGTFYAIRHALPHLRKSGRGSIVAVSSIAAQMCQARNAQGAAAKAGVEALIRVVAKEEGKRGIRANVISIGLTDTDMGRAAFDEWGPEITKRVIAGIPLGRIGTPEEIARAILFVAGPDGAYITGKVLQVDGGQFIAA